MKYLSVRLLAGALVALTFAMPVAAQEEVVDEIVAVVGSDIILRSDVDGYAQAFVQQSGVPYSDQLWADALNQLIDQKVLATVAERDTTLGVTDDQVQQALDDRIQQLEAQVGGQAALEDLYGKPLLEIQNDLREDFRQQILVEQFRGRKLRAITITPSEVRQWFNRIPQDSLPTLPDVVRIAHIVRYPDVTAAAKQDALEIITAIRRQIVDSTMTFEEAAQQFTDDPGSKAQGGRYPNGRLPELEPEFAAMAARIGVGDVSQPFETSRGYHILRVNDRRGEIVDFNHVLISFDETQSDPSEAIAHLTTVRDSILTYDLPFELMARRHSEEAFSANRGGRVVDPQSGSRDLPLQALGVAWRRTIQDLDEGAISEPTEVQTLDGRRAYHLLKLERRVPEHRVNIETDYERIQEIALQEKQARELQRWVEQLKANVYIDVRGKGREALAQVRE